MDFTQRPSRSAKWRLGGEQWPGETCLALPSYFYKGTALPFAVHALRACRVEMEICISLERADAGRGSKLRLGKHMSAILILRSDSARPIIIALIKQTAVWERQRQVHTKDHPSSNTHIQPFFFFATKPKD